MVVDESVKAGEDIRQEGGGAGHAFRWTLCAALLVLVCLVLLEPGIWLAALVAAPLLCAVAFLESRRSRPRSPGSEPAPGTGEEAPPVLSGFDLAAAVADPLVVFDRQGILIHANAAAQDVFGPLPAGTMMQLRFRAPELQRLIENAMDGTIPEASVDYVERLPIERLYRLSVAPLGRRGDLSVLVFRDQSEARRIDRMRADFIANASHEMRTPLASISGFIETLRGPARNDVAARERFLGIMQDQTARMARLIDDLLSLSRIEMRAMLKPGETADLKAILAGVVEANALRAHELGVSIEADLPDEAPVVQGDRDELFQVFENLVENACKYGRSGKKVEVSLSRGEDSGQEGIAARVRDHGPGIPSEHIPRITERFYRIDMEASRNQKGTGLGLAIVKHIVTRHNARLIIRSKVGEGTEFTVFFPDEAGRK